MAGFRVWMNLFWVQKIREFGKRCSGMNFKQWMGRQWQSWRGTILFVVFVLVPVKSVLADWNWVPTGSMNPTILEGDLVYVDKLAYDLRVPLTLKSLVHRGDPERGDVSILFSPLDNTRLVKRVIGIPGDVIEMKNHLLTINGVRLEYEELDPVVVEDLNDDLKRVSVFASERLGEVDHAMMVVPGASGDLGSFERVVVPEGHYFVMGDHRDNSLDSRSFGFVERKMFVGKAKRVIASFDILDRYQPRLGRFFSSLD